MNRKIILALALMVVCSPAVFAQGAGVSPILQVLHSNKNGTARGSFNVLNNSLRPAVTMLSVQRFVISEDGQIAMQPPDPQDRFTLSSTSVRVPPQGSSGVSFEADCPDACAFFVLTSIANEAKTDAGLAVRVVVPETIYCFHTPIRKVEISTQWLDERTLLVQNNGSGGDRPEVDLVTLDGKTQPFPSLALLPGAKRILRFPVAPAKVILRGDKFKLEIAAQ